MSEQSFSLTVNSDGSGLFCIRDSWNNIVRVELNRDDMQRLREAKEGFYTEDFDSNPD